MSEYTLQLADLKGTLDGITNIGKVYDRPRYGDADRLWIVEIAGIPLIRAWEIGINGDTITDRLTQGHRSRYRPWRIQGYIGPIDIDEAPTSALWYDPEGAQITDGYTAALDLADTIVDAIEADRTLGGTCLDLASPSGENLGCKITAPVVLNLPGPLCWGVGIEFWTWTHPTG